MLTHLAGWPFVVVMALMFAAIFGIVHGTAIMQAPCTIVVRTSRPTRGCRGSRPNADARAAIGFRARAAHSRPTFFSDVVLIPTFFRTEEVPICLVSFGSDATVFARLRLQRLRELVRFGR
jgi:hypothetical protein